MLEGRTTIEQGAVRCPTRISEVGWRVPNVPIEVRVPGIETNRVFANPPAVPQDVPLPLQSYDSAVSFGQPRKQLKHLKST